MQPSMVDKGFLTHYMICKYIDDLPNSWCTEDLTNATTGGDLTAMTVCNESSSVIADSELRNEHAFSTKGVGLVDTIESNCEITTQESATNTTDVAAANSRGVVAAAVDKMMSKFGGGGAVSDGLFQPANQRRHSPQSGKNQVTSVMRSGSPMIAANADVQKVMSPRTARTLNTTTLLNKYSQDDDIAAMGSMMNEVK